MMTQNDEIKRCVMMVDKYFDNQLDMILTRFKNQYDSEGSVFLSEFKNRPVNKAQFNFADYVNFCMEKDEELLTTIAKYSNFLEQYGESSIAHYEKDITLNLNAEYKMRGQGKEEMDSRMNPWK